MGVAIGGALAYDRIESFKNGLSIALHKIDFDFKNPFKGVKFLPTLLLKSETDLNPLISVIDVSVFLKLPDGRLEQVAISKLQKPFTLSQGVTTYRPDINSKLASLARIIINGGERTFVIKTNIVANGIELPQMIEEFNV